MVCDLLHFIGVNQLLKHVIEFLMSVCFLTGVKSESI